MPDPFGWAQQVVNGVHNMRFAVALPSIGFAASAALALSSAAPAVAAENPTSPTSLEVSADVDPATDVRVYSSSGPGGGASPQAAAACGPFSAYGPPGGAWGPIAAWVNCSFWGTSSTSVKGYTWSLHPASIDGLTVCTSAFGYDNKVPYWTGAGCGTSGGKTVKWGNVAGIPKFKIRSLGIYTGATVGWY